MAMKNLDYDYCHAAPVLEWMSQKWALVAMMRIEESCRDKTDRGVRFGDLFRTIPHISEKVLASTLNYLDFSLFVFFFVVATCFDAKHHYLCN